MRRMMWIPTIAIAALVAAGLYGALARGDIERRAHTEKGETHEGGEHTH